MISGSTLKIESREYTPVALPRFAVALLDLTHDALLFASDVGEVLALNERAEALTGWSCAEMVGRQVSDFLLPGTAESEAPIASSRASTSTPGSHTRMLRQRSGKLTFVTARTSLVKDPQDPRVEILVIAMQPNASAESGATRGGHDSIPGRSEFLRAVHASMATAAPLQPNVVVYVGVDDLATTNRTTGRPAGDRLLDLAIASLASVVGEDDRLARLDGDSFGLLLHGIAIDVAEDRLRHVFQQFAASTSGQSADLPLATLSAAVVAMVDDSIDAASLLAEAESACRSAQHGGVRRIVTMDANSTVFQRHRNELRLASLLSLALDNDSIEITLGRMHALSAPDADPPHFEVQIAVRDEAGQALPTERLAVAAERFGLQSALDRWVVSTLLPRLVADSRAGALPPNAVLVLRLSAQSIAEAGTLTFLRRRIVESGIEPARIVFRVSESAVLARAVPSIRLFAGLRQLGCKLMIDEVGGGQSSFAYLKNVGVDYVALDRDLVPAAMRERTERAMLAAVMRLSEMLDMRTVAPAVADVTELAALRDMGIDFAMGSSSAIAKASA